MNQGFEDLNIKAARSFVREMLNIYREVKNQGVFVSSRNKGTFKPEISLHELNNELIILAEIAELDKNREVRVTLRGHILLLSGVIKLNGKPVPFQRQVILPADSHYREKTATYQNGVLEIRLFKEGLVKPREVKVNFL